MKGMIFTEFLSLIETSWGEDTVDDVIEACALPSGGAYTACGTYDHKEFLALITALSNRVGLPAETLIKRYAAHILDRLSVTHPELIRDSPDLFHFLEDTHRRHQAEVQKIYPEAELPLFGVRRDGAHTLILEYRSARPFALLAEGMIEAASRRFNEPVAIASEMLDGGAGHHARFTVRRLRPDA